MHLRLTRIQLPCRDLKMDEKNLIILNKTIKCSVTFGENNMGNLRGRDYFLWMCVYRGSSYNNVESWEVEEVAFRCIGPTYTTILDGVCEKGWRPNASCNRQLTGDSPLSSLTYTIFCMYTFVQNTSTILIIIKSTTQNIDKLWDV